MAGEDPIISGMAGRYANALFELALEDKATDAVKADLDQFDALIAESADLNRLVRSPVFGADEQLRALAAILDKAGITGLAANFLRVITTNRRLFAVRDMIRGYRALVAHHKGEVTAERHRRRAAEREESRRAQGRAQIGDRRQGRSTSTSRSIPPSSAG